MDVPERQLSEFGDAVQREAREIDAPPKEHAREDEHEHARNEADRGLAARVKRRPKVDDEMGTLADADHGPEHDRPDETESRQLLGPDVARDELGVAREDLQRNRNDQDRD